MSRDLQPGHRLEVRRSTTAGLVGAGEVAGPRRHQPHRRRQAEAALELLRAAGAELAVAVAGEEVDELRVCSFIAISGRMRST